MAFIVNILVPTYLAHYIMVEELFITIFQINLFFL